MPAARAKGPAGIHPFSPGPVSNTMLRNILLVGFVSAASAFVAPVSLRNTPAVASARVAQTPMKMIESETIIQALPAMAALGLTLQHKYGGGGISAAQSAVAQAEPIFQPAIVTQPDPVTVDLRTVDMRTVARENFQKWNDALQTKDPKTVADMYSTKDLSFLPTVSPEHIKNSDSTEEYFTAFVQKNPFGTITDDSVTVFDKGDAYLHSGMYTFELGEGDARAPVEARFSYVWRKFGSTWKITHHHSSVQPSTPDMLQTARDNFHKWNDALQTKDPETVAKLYATSGLSFLPTVSPEHIKNSDSTEEYFTAFVQKNPFGTITDDSVTVFDKGDAYLHSGMYTFELGEGDARAPVEARFSYVWRRFGPDWKITHHHSSVRPADPAAPAAKKTEEVQKAAPVVTADGTEPKEWEQANFEERKKSFWSKLFKGKE